MRRLPVAHLCFCVLPMLACEIVCDSQNTVYCLFDESCQETQPGGICVFDGETGKYCTRPALGCASGREWIRAGATGHNCECVPPELAPDLRPPPDAVAIDSGDGGM